MSITIAESTFGAGTKTLPGSVRKYCTRQRRPTSSVSPPYSFVHGTAESRSASSFCNVKISALTGLGSVVNANRIWLET